MNTAPHCRDLEPFTLDPSVHCTDPGGTIINDRITHRVTPSILTQYKRKEERKGKWQRGKKGYQYLGAMRPETRISMPLESKRSAEPSYNRKAHWL